MSYQGAFDNYLSRLYSLHQGVCLHLPANQESLQRQVAHLLQTQADLEHLQHTLLKQTKWCRSLALKRAYQRLLPFIFQIIRVVENYKILAEEFPFDPHGSIDCLAKIQQRNQRLLYRLKALEHELLQSEQKSA